MRLNGLAMMRKKEIRATKRRRSMLRDNGRLLLCSWFFFSLDRGFFLPTFQSAIVIISLIIYSHATRLSSRWYFPPSVTRHEGYTVSIHGTLTRWLVDLFGKIYKRKMMENTEKKGTRLSYKNSISILSFKRCSSKWWKQSFGNWQVSLPRWFQKAIVWDRQW